MAWRAIGPGGVQQGAIVQVQLRADSDLLLTMVAETISLVPGSLVLDLDREERLIAVHLLHVHDLADVERQKPACSPRRTASSGHSGRRPISPRSTAGTEDGRDVDAVTVVATVCHALLGGGALLALVRLARGPSLLDRVVATDTLLVIISASLAVHAALERDATVVPVLVVVSLLAFVGSVSIARYIGGMLVQPAAEEPEARDERRRGRRRPGLPGGRCLPLSHRGGRPRAVPRRPVADARGDQAAGARRPAGDGGRRDPAAGLAATWMLLLVAAFQLLTAPVSAHMISRVAYRRRHVRRDLLLVDELREAERRESVSRGDEPEPAEAGPRTGPSQPS